MITRRQFAVAVLALAIIASIVYILAGCAQPYPAKKVTQGDRSWITCSFTYHAGSIELKDRDGRDVTVYGNAIVEDSDEYVCKDFVPVKK